jgi:glycosyltransferase involved in cell wall biosynthesis
VPTARLVIGGFGEAKEQWEERARELGLADRVHWLGLRNDGPVVVRAFDVAAMSSEREGMPMFAFEAMAAGKPFVATDVGGLRDIFESGENAMLVPPNDARAMAAALEKLLLDDQLRASMGSAGQARLADFGVDRAVERITALYESLLAKAR